MTDAETLCITVTHGDAGSRLDAVLGRAEGIESRAEAQRLIESGAVRVNGEVRPKRHALAAGDVISQTQSAVVLENLIGQMISSKATDAGSEGKK